MRDEMIRLGQLLKLAGMVEDGAEARTVISEGLVTVDGEVDTRRGAQVRPGSVVTLGEEAVQVVDGAAEDGSYDDGLPW
ncbi:RNA-binding S4 domain-containing protein [Nocardioidaceae bacterium]|nr:RNA-binding S4 domain-containing protein [Nocardioidaceae bacterium]